MTTIKMTDLNGVEDVSPVTAEQVKGGPIFMKYEGVDGTVEARSTPKLQEAVANGTF